MDQNTEGVVPSNTSTSSRSGVSRPTLFNLLEVLASDSMTTPQQRHSIRDIVTEFLANKFEHSKVYSYIGAVVGHDRLHAVIKQLEADPDRAPLPDQNGLMRIESAFNLSRACKTVGNTTTTPNIQGAGGSKIILSHLNDNNGSVGGGGSSSCAATKEEILKSIRRNLNAKRIGNGILPGSTSKLSDSKTASAGILLQKACWLPVRRSLSAGALYGHSLICIGSRAYILGGSNGRLNGTNLARAHVISLVDFGSKQIYFTGEVPSQREGNSCNVAVIQQSHSIIIFGGFNGERFFNDVYILELEKRKWYRRHAAGRAPAPRDEHSALIYPASCESAQKTKSGAEYLFIFGGKTGLRSQLQCLNDMWAFHVESGTWSLVEIPTGPNNQQSRPAPRFGVCALWADDDTICIFGGETCGPSGFVDRSERCLLDDLWMFRLTQAPLVGEWTREHYEGNIGPRSHYTSIFIAQRCKELHTGVPRTIERLMLLTGGLTYAPGKRSVIASDKLYFYFFSQRRWYILKPNYPRNFVGEPFEPRQLHVACFFEKRNILFPASRPSVPCIFFHGGFHRKQVLSDAWVLSLTGEELFLRNSVVSPNESAIASTGGVANGKCIAMSELRSRIYPPWYYRESHSPDLLGAFASVQHWAFGAIAHLISNSIKESVNCTRISVMWEQTPQGDGAMFSIQDDGNGLDYGAMNRLLKLFGQSTEKGSNSDYGCGFKMAFARTATSCAVMSRTHDSIGIGMLSLELMGQCESREMAAPLCMWRLPSKELINKDGSRMVDQRHHQRLLMTYSPFNSATLLAEQINVLGTSPGTRILFWNLRRDFDCIWYNNKECNLTLRSFLQDEPEPMDNILPYEEFYKYAKQGWMLNFPLWSAAEYSIDYSLPTFIFWMNLQTSCIFQLQGIELYPCDSISPIKLDEEHSTTVQGDVEMKDDVSSKEFVYNCHGLKCSICGLKPVSRSLSDERTLWAFLKRRLYCRVDLPYLFTPSDHQNGCFIILGFVNCPPGVPRMPLDRGERLCETGILLYHKNRLISRLEGHFPASVHEIESSKQLPTEGLFRGELYRFALTVIVSVPNWLIPSVNKQEFVHENNLVFTEFKNRLKFLIIDYLKVCLDENERTKWQQERVNKIQLYDEMKKQQLDAQEKASDEEAPPSSWNTMQSKSNVIGQESNNDNEGGDNAVDPASTITAAPTTSDSLPWNNNT